MDCSRPASALVVDDRRTCRTVAVKMLEHLGFSEVHAALSGDEALMRAKERRYDLVLSDLKMSEMDGLDLLRGFRSDPQLQTTPFLIMTGDFDGKRFQQAHEAGVNGILLKPLQLAELEARIQTAL